MEHASGELSKQSVVAFDAARIKSHPDGASAGVAEAIMAGIRTGQMAPGQHLLEADLVIRFGVSRHSLRPALHRLAADGVVRFDRFRGAYLNVFDRQTAFDLLDAVGPLICYAAECCVRNLHKLPSELADTGRMQAAADPRSPDFLFGRHRFYSKLFELSDNRQLSSIIPMARIDLLRAQLAVAADTDSAARDIADYQRITAAILSGDAAAAAAAVRQHLANRRRTVADTPDFCFAPNSETLAVTV